jgi:hypothetical protein
MEAAPLKVLAQLHDLVAMTHRFHHVVLHGMQVCVRNGNLRFHLALELNEIPQVLQELRLGARAFDHLQ